MRCAPSFQIFDDDLKIAASNCCLRLSFPFFQLCPIIRWHVPYWSCQTRLTAYTLTLNEYLNTVHSQSPFLSIPFSVSYFMSELSWETCASTPVFVFSSDSGTLCAPSFPVPNKRPCAVCSHLHKRVRLHPVFVGTGIYLRAFIVQRQPSILCWKMWMVHENWSRCMHTASTSEKKEAGI